MLSVLIVDDERIDREAYKIMIENGLADFEIIGEAENGVEAIEKCNLLNPDLILLDINMPMMNGIEVMKELRRSHPTIQIIIISAYDRFDYAKEALYQGAAGYILKPVSEQDLLKELTDFKERMSTIAGRSNEKNYPAKVKEILEYCEKNYQNDINLNTVAAALYMSPNNIGKLMKEHIGTNFTDYLSELRINKAKKLLENTDDSINDISESVGYKDANYFIKVFKRIVDTTPSRYRKRLKWNENFHKMESNRK